MIKVSTKHRLFIVPGQSISLIFIAVKIKFIFFNLNNIQGTSTRLETCIRIYTILTTILSLDCNWLGLVMLTLTSAKVMLILQYSGMSKFCWISAKNVAQCSWESPKSCTIETDSEPSLLTKIRFWESCWCCCWKGCWAKNGCCPGVWSADFNWRTYKII